MGVLVGVKVGLGVGVLVGLGVGVTVGVFVGVGVGVGVEQRMPSVTALEVTALAPWAWMKDTLVMPFSPRQETGPHQVMEPLRL